MLVAGTALAGTATALATNSGYSRPETPSLLAQMLDAHGFGLLAGVALVREPNPTWAAGAAALIAALPTTATWEHAGSTSVPGLPAKPICDLVGFAPTEADLGQLGPVLESLGFVALGEFGIPGRRFFRLHSGGSDYAHLHTYVAGHSDGANVLAFRDALRADGPLREAYAATKFAALAGSPGNRDAYTAAKAPFIQGQLQRNR